MYKLTLMQFFFYLFVCDLFKYKAPFKSTPLKKICNIFLSVLSFQINISNSVICTINKKKSLSSKSKKKTLHYKSNNNQYMYIYFNHVNTTIIYSDIYFITGHM